MKIKVNKKVKIFLILLLFGLGFYLRMVNYLNFSIFKGDEGNHFLIFDNFLRFGQLGITGEGSSLGDKNLYFHNLPYSLYFEMIIFILSGQSPLTYMFFYVLLSLFLAWLIWQIARNLSDEKAGLLALFLIIFSGQAIENSTFASQPTNAILFEAMSLYFYSLFYRKGKKTLFILSFAFGVFALHMYPPMYLFLPIKIIFLLVNFSKIILQNKKVILICSLILVLSYLPLIINELNYYGQESSNLWNVKNFLIQSETASKKVYSQLFGDFIRQSWLILKSNTYCIDFHFYTLAAPFWLLIIFSSFFVKKNKKKQVIYLFLSVITPVIIAGFLMSSGIIEDFLSRAYFHNTLIYIVLLSAITLSRKLKIAAILIVAIIVFNFKKPEKIVSISFFEKQEVAKQIISNSKQRSLSLEEINIRVLNDKYGNNDGNWDNSMYWYFLQKNSKKQLVSVTYPFLTPDLISGNTRITYLICENYQGLLKLGECQKKAEFLYPKGIIQNLSYNKKLDLIAIYE